MLTLYNMFMFIHLFHSVSRCRNQRQARGVDELCFNVHETLVPSGVGVRSAAEVGAGRLFCWRKRGGGDCFI